MKESERVLKSMTLGDVLDYSVDVYRRNFKKIFLIVLIMYLPLVFVEALIQGKLQGDQFSLYKEFFGGLISNGTPSYDALHSYSSSAGSTFALTMLSYLFNFLALGHLIVLMPVMNAAIIKVVYNDVVLRKEQSFKENIGECFRRMGPLVGNWVLFGLILAGIVIGIAIAVLIIYLIVVFAGAFMFASGSTPVVVTGIVLMCIIALAVILTIAVFYSYFRIRFYGLFSVIIERKSATDAISRSLELTKKSFWQITLAYLFSGLILSVFTGIATYATYIGLFLNNGFYIVFFVISKLIVAVLGTFTTVVISMLFINMRIKKEGLDLEVRVDELLMQENRSGNGEAVNA